MPSRVISNPEDLEALVHVLRVLKCPLTVSWVSGRDRSREQNALSHRWYAEIGKQTGETPLEVKNRAKLDIGCPILCEADAEFNDMFIDLVQPLPRERQLQIVQHLEVTSALTVKQMTAFLEAFERQHRAEGLFLSHPDDRGRE